MKMIHFNMSLHRGCCLFIFAITLFYTNGLSSIDRGVNGGIDCAVCTILTGVVQQRAYLEGISFYNGAKQMCTKLPESFQNPCLSAVKKLKPILDNTENLEMFTPDVFCYALQICYEDPGQHFCHLFPEPKFSFHTSHKYLRNLIAEQVHSNNENDVYSSQYLFDKTELNYTIISNYFFREFHFKDRKMKFCDLPIISKICRIFMGTSAGFTPAFDLDGDGFSRIDIARGSNWRGKDCDDIDKHFYPGANPEFLDIDRDSNCNGIWGVDNITGRPWEDLLCENTESKGLVYIGDSMGAHFHFPEPWMNPNIPNNSSYSTITKVVLDEFDWPELSFGTGYKNSSYPDLINGITDSIYLRLKNHNRCNHRDFQNAARNAAMAVDFSNLIKSFTRHPYDKPCLVIFGMMGNDVCNRFPDTIGNMTTPKQFEELVLKGLSELDEKLPKSSDVVLMELIDADFIYLEMAERIHPLGSVLNNIKYKNVYDWFSCMQISPCNGWMTPNATLRKITSERSRELSLVLKNIAESKKYISFRLHYVENPVTSVISTWINQGREVHELIDPIDSLHASQLAQPLLADALWNSLKKINVLGSANPQNSKIAELFGDQGGY